MSITIASHQLWKIEVPTGRVIGDCTCHYNALDVLVVCLKTDQGHSGWGFGETVSKGVFTKPAPWITPMPSLDQIQREFERDVWPILQGRNPFSAKMRRPASFSGHSYLPTAVRIALWDLMAQMVELPLYQLMGGSTGENRVRAYGSGLDFPLSEEEAVELFKSFVARGFKAVKVKVGHPDMQRDLRRLQAVREAVGEQVEVAIDANEAWTCEEAIQRIRLFQNEGMRLAYVEDPLPRMDMDGLVRLNAAIELDVVGHDYILDPKELRRFVEHEALGRVRVAGDPDIALACADISAEFGVPLIFGNSMFELSVHAATALPQVDRLEFSGLAWNLLPRSPVRFENGYAIAPSQPGHGLDPDPEMLQRYSRPEASPPFQ
jgi:L-alanine-DL-glutamate epimerase-like enolase superfamily enzyme